MELYTHYTANLPVDNVYRTYNDGDLVWILVQNTWIEGIVDRVHHHKSRSSRNSIYTVTFSFGVGKLTSNVSPLALKPRKEGDIPPIHY
jgi:hypothetical protein